MNLYLKKILFLKYKEFSIISSSKAIRLTSERKEKILLLKSITYFEASGNYSRACLENDELTEFFTVQIGELEQKLNNHGFIRINRQLLVNIQHITEVFKGKSRKVHLSTGKTLSVSVRKLKSLKDTLQNTFI